MVWVDVQLFQQGSRGARIRVWGADALQGLLRGQGRRRRCFIVIVLFII